MLASRRVDAASPCVTPLCPRRSSFIFVFDPAGRLFVQRRAAAKETFPRHYDMAPGGVVGAGESYEENAAREAEEEMGITGVPFEFLFDFFYEVHRLPEARPQRRARRRRATDVAAAAAGGRMS